MIYTIINKNPHFLLSTFLGLKVAINCKNIVTAIKINILSLKSVANIKGLIAAPNPTKKQRFKILEPDIFPNNKSVSFLLADIIPVMISGRAVPAATIVIPINLSDNPNLLAIITELSTTKSEPNFNPKIPKII